MTIESIVTPRVVAQPRILSVGVVEPHHVDDAMCKQVEIMFAEPDAEEIGIDPILKGNLRCMALMPVSQPDHTLLKRPDGVRALALSLSPVFTRGVQRLQFAALLKSPGGEERISVVEHATKFYPPIIDLVFAAPFCMLEQFPNLAIALTRL